MTAIWSTELMKWEYKDLQATAMSVDWTGNNVLLAGRKWLAIKQISIDSLISTSSSDDSGKDTLKKFPRDSKYDATGVEWCQTQAGQRLCAVSSNQRVDVYKWGEGDLSCTNSLRGHTRVVSDTHFHRQDHNIIATCSIDTYTHLWDLRDARKPVLSFRAVGGVSQVQWNKVVPDILATAHDGDIKIWDKRKPSTPIQYISAHLSKIHGVDWSPHHEYQLVTSSHDGSIKYFNTNNPRRPDNTITTNFPVWRAIYTPFGSGLLTIGVGYGGVPRGEQAGVVGVWVGGTLTHRLVGHTDTVQQMVWRPNTLQTNYQLITWARDQTLRMWAMHPTLLKKCYHYLPEDSDVDDELSDTASISSTLGSYNDLSTSDGKDQDIQMVKLSTTKINQSLDDEFESVKESANVILETNKDNRTCTITMERNGYIAKLQTSFPSSGDMVIPKFSWLSGTTLECGNTIKILKAINATAYKRMKNGQICLLHCLKTLANCVDQIPPKPNEDSNTLKQLSKSQSESESAGDACIPFPRTCGAKWGAVSTLVLFNRPPNARRLSLKHDSGTPRSMSSLSMLTGVYGSGYTSVSPHGTTTPSPTNGAVFPHSRFSSNSITTFYFQDRWKPPVRRSGNGSGRSRTSSMMSTPRVVLYSADHLFTISRTLADKYIINNADPIEMCKHNAQVALDEGDNDLMRSWILAGLAANALQDKLSSEKRLTTTVTSLFQSSEESVGWALHPLCSNLVQSLISHYASVANVQMAAMLACTFAVFNDNTSSSAMSTTSCSSFGNGISPYNTVHQFGELNLTEYPQKIRSNSWSETPDPHLYSDSTLYSRYDGAFSCVLDEASLHLFHGFKRAYADILHRWQLLNVRTEVMKQVTTKYEKVPERHIGLELMSECQRCKVLSSEAACNKCSYPSLSCSVCNVSIRGVATACLACGHAGHAVHIYKWFSANDMCPSGCGCKCLKSFI